MNDLHWLQALALVISTGYCGILLCLFIGEMVGKIKTYFNNSSNGTAVMFRTFTKRVGSTVQKGGEKTIWYCQQFESKTGLLNKTMATWKNIKRRVWKGTKELVQTILEACGIRKRKLSDVDYKKKK